MSGSTWSTTQRCWPTIATPVRALIAIATALVAVSVLLPRLPAVLHDPELPWVQLLDVRAEQNLHTWFNVALSAVGSASFFLGSRLVEHNRRAWLLVSATWVSRRLPQPVGQLTIIGLCCS